MELWAPIPIAGDPVPNVEPADGRCYADARRAPDVLVQLDSSGANEKTLGNLLILVMR